MIVNSNNEVERFTKLLIQAEQQLDGRIEKAIAEINRRLEEESDVSDLPRTRSEL